jgi:hypothetical protein
MKGLHILGVMLITTLAISAVSVVGVSSAAAAETKFCTLSALAHQGLYGKRKSAIPDGCEEDLVPAEGEWELYEDLFIPALWLESGVAVSSTLLVETEGELELISKNAGGLGIASKVLCSSILDGWIGTGGLDFISELLTLGGVAVPSTELTGTALLCTNISNCTEPEVWASKLGWETEAELTETVAEDGGTTVSFNDLIFNSGWYVQCLILGVTASETCSAPEAAAKLTNEAGGTVDNEFSDEIQEHSALKLGNCTLGGTETSEINGLEITLAPGVTLSVSSE